jgi:hypothetical protein
MEQQAKFVEGSGENNVNGDGQDDGFWLHLDEGDRMSAALNSTTAVDGSEGSEEENEVTSQPKREGTTT